MGREGYEGLSPRRRGNQHRHHPERFPHGSIPAQALVALEEAIEPPQDPVVLGLRAM